jgi:2-phospho-L-lactate guanylyltransferase
MSRWHALVPIKAASERKTRLADHLSVDERERLSDAMLWHVLDILRASDRIGTVTPLTTEAIPGWDGPLLVDRRRGLNAELQAAAARLEGPLLVIHADLPNLATEDVEALAHAGEGGVALAPDRHHRGTNAIALGRPGAFTFAFGEASLARHRAGYPTASIVDRPGLSLDIDMADDLALLIAGRDAGRQGMRLSQIESAG